MSIVMITGLCLVCAIVCKAIERDAGEIKAVAVICAVCIVMYRISGELSSVLNTMQELFDRADIDAEYIDVIFKGVGICYITHLGCECCVECGEGVIAAQLSLAGKIAMIVISLPLFRALISMIEGLLY